MGNIYYTYAYLRENGTPYYIGKGHGDRAYQSQRRNGARKPKDIKRILILKKNISEEELNFNPANYSSLSSLHLMRC